MRLMGVCISGVYASRVCASDRCVRLLGVCLTGVYMSGRRSDLSPQEVALKERPDGIDVWVSSVKQPNL